VARAGRACKKAIERIIKRSPEKSKTIQVGFIALNKQGEYGGFSLQPGFTYSVKSNTIEQVFSAKKLL
jgi:N4-(beta-N-acetylglucosaminyl)-L-asparaginase